MVGLQIDIDFPTRLLGRYEKTLKALRGQLKPGTQLSITGLPTWMQSTALGATLAQHSVLTGLLVFLSWTFRFG